MLGLAEAAARPLPNAHRGNREAAEKWHPLKTLAFVGLVCGTFWAGVAWLIVEKI